MNVHNSIGLADASFVSRLLESNHTSTENTTNIALEGSDESHIQSSQQSSAIKGFFKREWSTKHYRRRPAVVVVFLDREDITGEPQRWTRVTGQVDTVRYRNIHTHHVMTMTMILYYS